MTCPPAVATEVMPMKYAFAVLPPKLGSIVTETEVPENAVPAALMAPKFVCVLSECSPLLVLEATYRRSV